MSIYNLIEYSDNYKGTTGRLWHYLKEKQLKDPIIDSISFKFKVRFSAITNNCVIENTEIAVALKYLRISFRELLKCL